jgi:hypothetical protein
MLMNIMILFRLDYIIRVKNRVGEVEGACGIRGRL